MARDMREHYRKAQAVIDDPAAFDALKPLLRGDDGTTLLHMAAIHDDAAMVLMLLERQADINALAGKTGAKGTPLWMALAYAPSEKTATLLIQNKAKVDIGANRTMNSTMRGEPAFSVVFQDLGQALLSKRWIAADLLIQEGASDLGIAEFVQQAEATEAKFPGSMQGMDIGRWQQALVQIRNRDHSQTLATAIPEAKLPGRRKGP